MNSTQLFDKLHASYIEHETLGRNPNASAELMFTFCNVLYVLLHEPQTLLTKEQIDKMFAVLTEEQLSTLSKKFKKNDQFWY